MFSHLMFSKSTWVILVLLLFKVFIAKPIRAWRFLRKKAFNYRFNFCKRDGTIHLFYLILCYFRNGGEGREEKNKMDFLINLSIYQDN